MLMSLPCVDLLDKVVYKLFVAALVVGAGLEGALGHLFVLDVLEELSSPLLVLLCQFEGFRDRLVKGWRRLLFDLARVFNADSELVLKAENLSLP